MTTYQLLLFVHVSAVIFWLGSELLAHLLAIRAVRQNDDGALRQIFDEINALDPVFFPAVLAVVVSGILMVVTGPWSFSDPFVIIGLAGFGLILVYGFALLQPQVKLASKMIKRDGGVITPESRPVVRRFFTLWGIETAILFGMVFAMTTKPQDAATLTALVVVVAATSTYLAWRTHSTPLPGRSMDPNK